MAYRNRFLAVLDPSELAAIASNLVEITLTAGEVLYAPGEQVETVYFPTSALISLATSLKDGRDVDAAAQGFEGVVGAIPALAEGPSYAKVFVQASGAARKLPAGVLRRAAHAHPRMMKLLLRHAQQDIAMAEQSAACNALHSVVTRLARWLLISQDRLESPLLPLTQDYLSTMVGAQRTTVTAAAQELKLAGLIRYSRGRIEVLDRAGLERAACECYASPAEWIIPLAPAPESMTVV